MRITVLLLQDDWWFDWVGETSALQWIGLFIAGLFAVSTAITIYLLALSSHIRRNRYPSMLRWLCLTVGAAIALIFYTFVFKDVLLFYLLSILSVIFTIISIVLFFSSRKTATK